MGALSGENGPHTQKNAACPIVCAGFVATMSIIVADSAMQHRIHVLIVRLDRNAGFSHGKALSSPPGSFVAFSGSFSVLVGVSIEATVRRKIGCGLGSKERVEVGRSWVEANAKNHYAKIGVLGPIYYSRNDSRVDLLNP